MDLERFVFIDEIGASTNMIRRYGWAPRSERMIAAALHRHWRTTTFVAGLHSTGLMAPLVLDGPMNGSAFLAYVRPAGASLHYLPPYSPDLNPIEQVFAKLKALFWGAAARTKDALWTTTGQLFDRFKPAECCNYLTSSSYEYQRAAVVGIVDEEMLHACLRIALSLSDIKVLPRR